MREGAGQGIRKCGVRKCGEGGQDILDSVCMILQKLRARQISPWVPEGSGREDEGPDTSPIRSTTTRTATGTADHYCSTGMGLTGYKCVG